MLKERSCSRRIKGTSWTKKHLRIGVPQRGEGEEGEEVRRRGGGGGEEERRKRGGGEEEGRMREGVGG